MRLLERKEKKKQRKGGWGNSDQEAPGWCCRDVVQGVLLSPATSGEHPVVALSIPWSLQ